MSETTIHKVDNMFARQPTKCGIPDSKAGGVTSNDEYVTCPLCIELLAKEHLGEFEKETKSNWQERNDTAEEIAALRAHADGY